MGTCKACGGSGKKQLACRYCGGTGAITSSGKAAGFFARLGGDSHTCKKCAGTGTFEVICRNCDGTGTHRGASKIGYLEMEKRRCELYRESLKTKDKAKRKKLAAERSTVMDAWINGK
ncbi:MAG: hypothetical protein LBT46_10175 [Planctomycetaceae bacterium]|nr:hypothetical protein [Planctomycetaceae bacterium]